MTNKEKFCSLVDAVLKEKRLSRYRLAIDCDIPHSSLSRFLNGKLSNSSEKNSTAGLRADHLINILYYLEIL